MALASSECLAASCPPKRNPVTATAFMRLNGGDCAVLPILAIAGDNGIANLKLPCVGDSHLALISTVSICVSVSLAA